MKLPFLSWLVSFCCYSHSITMAWILYSPLVCLEADWQESIKNPAISSRIFRTISSFADTKRASESCNHISGVQWFHVLFCLICLFKLFLTPNVHRFVTLDYSCLAIRPRIFWKKTKRPTFASKTTLFQERAITSKNPIKKKVEISQNIQLKWRIFPLLIFITLKKKGEMIPPPPKVETLQDNIML